MFVRRGIAWEPDSAKNGSLYSNRNNPLHPRAEYDRKEDWHTLVRCFINPYEVEKSRKQVFSK